MPPRKGTKRKADEPVSASQPQDLPVRAKDDSPLPSIAPSKPSAQGTLQVFDSDDEDNVAVTTTLSAVVKKPAVIADSEEDSDSDDDDEAPEAVGTTHVVTTAEKAAESALLKAQEQAAEQKRKRQQKDALFKQQASERKANKASTRTEQGPEPAGRRRADKIDIPDVLPDEFLDSSSEGEDDEVDSVAESRPKRRKVSVIEQKLGRLDRGPRDERIGNTVYRVEKKRDDRMAPKLKKSSQSRKGGLLSRGRAPVASKGGFFKK